MSSFSDNFPDAAASHSRLPDDCLAIARKYFAETGSERWQLSFKSFQSGLWRGAAKRFGQGKFSVEQFAEHCSTLHLQDLALACACAEGSELAWEEFVGQYRGYLRIAAAAILRCPNDDPAATELADSLFSDLYGLPASSGVSAEVEGASHRSLFRYFHGRSSLKTWLRAVLAQRHVDRIRASRKFDSLEAPGDGEPHRISEPAVTPVPLDPRREQYLQRFREALGSALAALDPRDRTRLQLYYAEDQTLAQIGKQLGEHESSVSRNMERVRKELRLTVEGLLRAGRAAANGGPASAPGLDDAQIALCIQYAAEDAPIDLDKLFNAEKSPGLHGSSLPGTNRLGPDRPDSNRKVKP